MLHKVLERYIERNGPPPLWSLNEEQEDGLNISVRHDMNIGIGMNSMMLTNGNADTLMRMYKNGLVRDINRQAKECNCPYHKGEVVRTAWGVLCNGEPFFVQLDGRGYHVLIGLAALDCDNEFPEGVDEEEVERLFKEALRD